MMKLWITVAIISVALVRCKSDRSDSIVKSDYGARHDSDQACCQYRIKAETRSGAISHNTLNLLKTVDNQLCPKHEPELAFNEVKAKVVTSEIVPSFHCEEQLPDIQKSTLEEKKCYSFFYNIGYRNQLVGYSTLTRVQDCTRGERVENDECLYRIELREDSCTRITSHIYESLRNFIP